MKQITWECDECHKREQGYILPSGFLQVSYWNDRTEKWWRFDVCSYTCLAKWAAKQGGSYTPKNIIMERRHDHDQE